jgi:hypothetical protein
MNAPIPLSKNSYHPELVGRGHSSAISQSDGVARLAELPALTTRTIGILTLIVAAITVLWAVLFMVTEVAMPAVPTLAGRIALIEGSLGLFVLNYANAGLLTLAAVVMLAALCVYCRQEDPLWTAVALVFVPIYGLANLVVYLSQVFVVPGLLDLYRDPATAAVAEILLRLALHTWPGSAAGFVNALAYAALGIPSVILGLLLARRAPCLRAGGRLLALSGVLAVVALVGVGIGDATLAFLSPLGGFVYLVGLILLGVRFLRAPSPGALIAQEAA